MNDGLLSHATIFLKHGRIEGHIDIDIASLIYGLWRVGINTKWCCQGGNFNGIDAVGDKLAYISFTSHKSRSRFLKLMRGSGVKFLLDEDSWPGAPGARTVVRFYKKQLPRIRKSLRLRGVPIMSLESISAAVSKSIEMACLAQKRHQNA